MRSMYQKVTVGGEVVAGLVDVIVGMGPKATLQGQTLVPVDIKIVFCHTDRTTALQAVFNEARQRVDGQPDVNLIEGGVVIAIRPSHRPKATPGVLEYARAVFVREPVSHDGRGVPTYTWYIRADQGNYTTTKGDPVLASPFIAGDMAIYTNSEE